MMNHDEANFGGSFFSNTSFRQTHEKVWVKSILIWSSMQVVGQLGDEGNAWRQPKLIAFSQPQPDRLTQTCYVVPTPQKSSMPYSSTSASREKVSGPMRPRCVTLLRAFRTQMPQQTIRTESVHIIDTAYHPCIHLRTNTFCTCLGPLSVSGWHHARHSQSWC